MRLLKIFVLIILLTSGLFFLILLDKADRSIIYSRYTPEEEFTEFRMYKTTEEVKRAYERHFKDTIYKFPRQKVNKVKIFKNIPIISRLTGRKLNETEIISFFNNPENFDWNETTWSLDESEYILRFYDYNNEVIGKIWICLKDCGMTESIPFAPTMKFGALTETGRKQIEKIIENK